MTIRKIFILPAATVLLGSFLAGCMQQGAKPAPSPRTTNEPQPTYLEHTITFSGETLADIAAWYTGKATNWQAIRDANPELKPDRLRLGQVVLVPRSLVINDRPFTKSSMKHPASKAPEIAPTQSPVDGEPVPSATTAPSDFGSPAAATPEPTSAPQIDAPVTPTAAATPAGKPTSDDLEREKLLDELLK